MKTLLRYHRTHARLTVAALSLLLVSASLLIVGSAARAFQVEDRGTAGLDGKVVMSPASERITTIDSNGGDQIGPGSVVKRFVILHNRTKHPVTFNLDLNRVVGSTSELVVELPPGDHGGAAAWATIDKPHFTLKSGQQGTVLVTIKIPKTVKPGSKPFAVVATQEGGPTQTEGAGIAPQFRQVAIFIVDLPGDAPVKGSFTKATISSESKRLDAARHGQEPPVNARLYVGPGIAGKHRLTLTTEYKNTGERLLEPSGEIVVKDIFGRVAGRYPIKEFTVYPDGAASQVTDLKGLPSLGIFRTTVHLESEASGKQSLSLPWFIQVPKWFILALLAIVAYITWRIVRWRIRRRREWKSYMGDEGGEGDEGDEDWSDIADSDELEDDD